MGIQHLIKEKGVAVNALKNELIKIQNRKNQINEKDLEQKTKSQMRRMELMKVKNGQKMPYHHTLKRTRFGGIKWQQTNNEKTNIQSIYLQNKYKQLKENGKYEKFQKKTKKSQ